MPDFHFTVKGHPVGFIIEADSEENATKEYEKLSCNGNSGVHGFTIQDIESIELVTEREPSYMIGYTKIT